ncbi:hypothetical protein MMC16_004472, partial [Acarospora aff. strigata]|nr:hypothetical protein [Acarospora aff. strigata]
LHRRNENGVDILLDPKFLKAGLVQEDVNAIFVATVEHYAPSEHDGMRGVSCKFRRAVGHLGGVPEGMLPGDLCSKGYSRMNEFEAHESSYDHQHKKRLKEMKQMTRDPLASSKARRAERKADEKSGLITIKPVGSTSTSTAVNTTTTTTTTGFRKGGFRSAFGGGGGEKGEGEGEAGEVGVREGLPKVLKMVDEVGKDEGEGESDGEDEGDEYYDPERPTGCFVGCAGR